MAVLLKISYRTRVVTKLTRNILVLGVQGSATVTYGAPHSTAGQAPILPPGMGSFFHLRRSMDPTLVQAAALYPPFSYYGQGALPFR